MAIVYRGIALILTLRSIRYKEASLGVFNSARPALLVAGQLSWAGGSVEGAMVSGLKIGWIMFVCQIFAFVCQNIVWDKVR